MGLIILVGSFFVLLFAGVPIAFALGISPLIYILVTGNYDIILLGLQAYRGVDSFVFLAIPFFILAGSIMEEGKIAQNLIDLSKFIVRRLTGGLAMTIAVACTIFASITGSAPATTAAIGGPTLSALETQGYGRKWGTAFIAVAGTIGPVIPPSITMIVYGGMVGASISKLFIAGIVPGLLMCLALMVLAYIRARQEGIRPEAEEQKVSFKEGFGILGKSLLSLGMPIVILGGILLGVFTPTEAAVVAVVYALIVCVLIHRTLRLKDIPGIFVGAASVTGMIMFIVANATLFTWILSVEQGAVLFTQLIQSAVTGKFMTLLLMNLVVLVVGCFVDTTSALIMVTPVLAPLALSLGIDLVQLGIIFTVNLMIGNATPPVGLTLFTACSISKVSITDVIKPLMPMLLAMLVVLLIVTFFPSIIMFLPNLLIK